VTMGANRSPLYTAQTFFPTGSEITRPLATDKTGGKRTLSGDVGHELRANIATRWFADTSIRNIVCII
jgi:hypothetical protein